MSCTFNRILLPSLFLIGAGIAHAQDAAPVAASLCEAISEGKLLLNFRPRYEYVDQDGKAENANAFTVRTLLGWQTRPLHGFSVTAQIIDVSKLEDDFNDNARGVAQPGKGNYPVIADPDHTDFNQLFVEYSGLAATTIRLGRQSVKLDNVRIIGNVEFRQVMQVFDGIALENKSIPNTELYFAHYERVKQVTTKLRKGNLDIAHATYRFNPRETLTAYGYFVDMTNNGQNGGSGLGVSADHSHRTIGLRADGSHKLNDDWRLPYTVEYARQDDYRGGDNRIDTNYLRLGAGIGNGNWHIRLDHESLSSNNSLYAFQTPLGTNHLFQGWADLFLTTPRQGIRDNFLSLGGRVLNVQLASEYHVMKSDSSGIDYGRELDLSAGYGFNAKIIGKLEYARFREEDRLAGASRKPDTEKLWLTFIYNY